MKNNVLTALKKELEHAHRIGHAYYQVPKQVSAIMNNISALPVHAGLRLATSHKRLRPSPHVLQKLAAQDLPRAVVNDKSAWLYICGRDILTKGILTSDFAEKDTYILVMDQHGHCLGYGQVTRATDKRVEEIKNIYDIGDYLRRE